jgi:hypothetical protein
MEKKQMKNKNQKEQNKCDHGIKERKQQPKCVEGKVAKTQREYSGATRLLELIVV